MLDTDTELFKFEIRQNPKVSDEYVTRLLATYDPLLARQEIYGEWVDLHENRVYHQFDAQHHVMDLSHKLNVRDWPMYMGVDWNLGIMAAVGLCVCPQFIYVHTELSDSRDVYELRQKLQALPSPYIYSDAMGSALPRQLLSEAGLRMDGRRHNPKRVDRYALVNALLRNALGQRRLIIHPSCTRLIKDLDTICYKPQSDVPNDEGGAVGH